MSTGGKRKAGTSTVSRNATASPTPAEPTTKVHIIAGESNQPRAAAAAVAVVVDDSPQSAFMSSQYGLSQRAVAPPPPAAAGVVGVPWYDPNAELTPAQKAFVNGGLARWRQTRRAWVTGATAQAPDGMESVAAKGKKAAAAAAAASAAAAAQSSPSSSGGGGKTTLPHAMTSHAQPSPAKPPTRSSDDDDAGDQYFAATDDTGDEEGSEAASDINADVPRIIAARENYSVMEPRVKLSHMVDILNVCWEEEEDDA